MTAAVVQESSNAAAWDFGSAFAALSVSPIRREDRRPAVLSLVPPSTPALSRTLSQDDDETPKATPSIDIGTALGDFRQVLSYLGYSVSVTAPASNYDVNNSIISDDEGSTTTEKTPTRKVNVNQDNPSDSTDAEDTAISAKRAETGRRAVLDSYLGSSPDATTSAIKQKKQSKLRSTNLWVQNGLAPSTVVTRAVTRSRKQASMNVAAENKAKLILELHKQFPQDFRSSAVVPGPSIEMETNGIHCFVDISNILIGFHDTLKRHRQINKNVRIPRQTLSFHNLSLILERGRPAAKRFLAGSDDIDCTQEARMLGYTTHILQRVDKPDYVLPPGTRKGRRSGLTSSDTDSGTPGRTRRAEQAVDEVLHLGMLQSLLDTDVPSTIVLASGDAAKAEFSDGFLKQVERALLKGWKVEVIAFRATTGSAYRDPKWVSRWGDSFRLIPLDHYTEMLHIPYEGSSF